MLTLYFSGTGNSKYIAKLFSRNMNAACHSIEDDIDFDALVASNDTIAFCYPIYGSRVPRIMREFVGKHMKSLESKKIIIFCTQWLFSGDGARVFTELFPRGYMDVIYAEHFSMPNNISNMAILPMASDKSMRKYAHKSQRKIQAVCNDIKAGKVKRRGFNVISRFLGLFQGLFVPVLEDIGKNKVRITDSCTKCGVCVAVCPMKNFTIENSKVTHKHNCTMCYRCINKCPNGAITVFWHGRVKKSYSWKEY